MAKFNVKNLAIISFLGILLVGVMGIVNAQQALPKGGDSFETAVKLEAGSYQGGSLESKEVEYFYVGDIKPGEEINVKATFTAANVEIGAEAILSLYNEDKTKLVEKTEGFYEKPTSITVSWLAGTIKDTYKCYIKVGSTLFKIASYSLDISLKKVPVEEEKVAPGEAPPEEGVTPEEEGPKTVGITEGVPEGVAPEGPNWVLILGIIALIVIIGIIIYFLLKKKKK